MKLTAKKITLTALMAALTSLGAFIKISLPYSPVPITLQTLFVFLSGTLLGSNLGALSQLIYVLIGIAGIPVFAGFSGGLGVLCGPTGGYLVGFVISAWIIGKITERFTSSKAIELFLAILPGWIIIYLIGTVQLSLVLHLDIKQAIISGALPFIPGDLLKVIVAIFLTQKLKKIIL